MGYIMFFELHGREGLGHQYNKIGIIYFRIMSVMGWNWLVLACESWLLKFQELCEPVDMVVVAWNQPWWGVVLTPWKWASSTIRVRSVSPPSLSWQLVAWDITGNSCLGRVPTIYRYVTKPLQNLAASYNSYHLLYSVQWLVSAGWFSAPVWYQLGLHSSRGFTEQEYPR